MASAPKVKVRIELADRASLILAAYEFCTAALAEATPENKVRVRHHVADVLQAVGAFNSMRAEVDALRAAS